MKYCPYCGSESDDGYCENCDGRTKDDFIVKPIATMKEEEIAEIKKETREAIGRAYLLQNWKKFISIDVEETDKGETLRIEETGAKKEEFVLREVIT